jgi:hypothetical protein
MGKLVGSWRLLSGAGLAAASLACLALLDSARVLPSALRDPMSWFVSPGVTVWWLVLGGPFRSAPSTAGGLAFAALVNGLVWGALLWLVCRVVRAIRRKSGAPWR